MASPISLRAEVDQKTRFYTYFQQECNALNEQMDRLPDTATTGGERHDGFQHCQAGIARLAEEVKHASHYIPSYDQKSYAETIKSLTDKLQQMRADFAPRPKFTFKSIRKNPSAISINDAAELAQQRGRTLDMSSTSSVESSTVTTPAILSSPVIEPIDGHAKPGDERPKLTSSNTGSSRTAIRQPSLSQETSVTITNHKGMHLMLPSSAAHATSSGTLSNLRRCIVDMSIPTSSGRPFATLTIKNVKNSLLVCGNVSGPAHITGVHNGVIVVACRQFRMHECINVQVYLHCTSRPIIEDCDRIGFAPLPRSYTIDAQLNSENQWQKVDDFKWLKPEPSPNWQMLADPDRVKDTIWRNLAPGGPSLFGLDEILNSIPVTREEKTKEAGK